MPRPNPIQRARAIGVSRGVGMSVPASGPDAAHTILTILDAGGDAEVTTAGPHGLNELDSIVISGNTVPGYNGANTVGAIGSATTFLLAGNPYTADGTGGTWELA